MDASLLVLLLCSMAALSSACCTPDQWEGIETVIGGYADKRRHGLIREFLAVAYDAVNNRTAAFVGIQEGEDREKSLKLKVVTRYDDGADTGKLYVLDIKKDKCWTKTLKSPFRKACIPPDAKSVGSYFLGLYGGFNTTGYEIKGKQFGVFLTVEIVGDNECVPVAESIQGKVKKVDFIETVAFINVSRGIKNETVFDVPEKCEENESLALTDALNQEHYFMAI